MTEERLVAVYQQGQQRGTCRSCGAPITWAETTQHKRTLIDGDPVPLRSTTDPQTGEVIEYIASDTVHFVTCPHADDWRRRPRRGRHE